MNKAIVWVIFSAVCACSSTVYALDEDSQFYHNQYGGFASISNTTVQDNNGSVARSSTLSRAGVVYYYPIDRLNKVESGVYYQKDSYAASSREIGQKVSGYGLYGMYHYQIVISRHFRPLFGGGVAFNNFKLFSCELSGLQQ